ncbi:MAG TPA: ABC transporter permease subunit [Symbiobacteriaceae bacterium]|nr:ABC transporter permease subunit [Symbiobacteriaceae bacterium]
MTLFRQHAKTEAISTLIWASVLGLVGFVTVYIWDVVVKSGSLETLEKVLENSQGALKALVGSGGVSLVSMDGWVQGYVLGGWISLLYVIFTALFVAGIVTREMDRRTMEFLLSLPVSRTQLLLSRWLVLAGSLALLNLVHYLGVLGGLAALGQAGHPARYAVAILNTLLLHLFLGTLMLLASLFIDDYGMGTGATLGIGLGLTFFHMGTSDATGALKSLRELLPLSWCDVQPIVMQGHVPWDHFSTLVVGTGLLLAISVWVFQRKQIAV